MGEREQEKAPSGELLKGAETERRQLVSHLWELVRARGVEGAAQELGVSARTLRRVRASGALTPTLEETLSRHVAQTLASGDAPWWQRTDAFEARLARMDEAMQALAARLALVEEEDKRRAEEAGAAHRAAVQRIGKVEEAVKEVARAVGAQGDGSRAGGPLDTIAGKRGRPHQGGSGEAAALSAEVQRLVEERSAAKAEEEAATDRMERLAAAERRLEAELRLIRDHGETWPPGQVWSQSKRTEEVAWRLDALEAHRQERRRLERRRRLRRILTLGLWW